MFRIPYLPAILWLMVITLLSVSPGVPMPKMNLISTDKVGHLLAYGLLAWLLARGYKAANAGLFTGKAGLVLLCLAGGYGALMEFVQATFFPYRFFEWGDMLANFIGALLGIGIVWRR